MVGNTPVVVNIPSDEVRALSPGMDADFIAWNIDDYRCIPYHMAVPDVGAVFCGDEIRQPGERIV